MKKKAKKNIRDETSMTELQQSKIKTEEARNIDIGESTLADSQVHKDLYEPSFRRQDSVRYEIS